MSTIDGGFECGYAGCDVRAADPAGILRHQADSHDTTARDPPAVPEGNVHARVDQTCPLCGTQNVRLATHLPDCQGGDGPMPRTTVRMPQQLLDDVEAMTDGEWESGSQVIREATARLVYGGGGE